MCEAMWESPCLAELRYGLDKYTQDTSKCEILGDSSFSFSKPLKVSNSKSYCEFSKVLRMKKSIA